MVETPELLQASGLWLERAGTPRVPSSARCCCSRSVTDALCPTQLRELRGRNQLLRDRTALPSPHPDLCHQLKGLCWITRPEAGERGQAGLLPAATAPRVPEVPVVPSTRTGSGNNDPKASPREELPWLGAATGPMEHPGHDGSSTGGACSINTQKGLDVSAVWMHGWPVRSLTQMQAKPRVPRTCSVFPRVTPLSRRGTDQRMSSVRIFCD